MLEIRLDGRGKRLEVVVPVPSAHFRESLEAEFDVVWIAMCGENNLATAARYMERALDLDPANPGVLGNSATLLSNLGRLDEALKVLETLVRRDPVNVAALNTLGVTQLDAGRLEECASTFRTLLKLSPCQGYAHYGLGMALLLLGDAQGAHAEFEQETNELYRMAGLPWAYYALGREGESDAALSLLIGKNGHDRPFNVAEVYAFRGETDRAFEWLEKTLDAIDPSVPLIVTGAFFKNLHSDPRWLPFLREIGKAPEQLAQIEFHVTLPDDWTASP